MKKEATLIVKIPKELHTKLKVKSAVKERSIKELVVEILKNNV